MKKIGITKIIYTPQIELQNKDVVNVNIQCDEIWENLVIDWNGNLVLCHGDHESSIDLGNVKNSDLISLLNSETYRKLRKDHKNFDFHPLCQKCEYTIDSLVVDYTLYSLKK